MHHTHQTPVRMTSLLTSLVLLIPIISTACDKPQSPTAESESDPATETAADTDGQASASKDPLAKVLRLFDQNNPDAAIHQFVDDAPKNWVKSTEMEELQLSEAEFSELSRAERSSLQQQFIDRVGEIKVFAREVVARASKAKKDGNEERAEKYMEAVNKLGRQLREADVVIVFQQTGNALANVTIDE